MLQQQLTESSKRSFASNESLKGVSFARYGSDISSLEVEIAKKDARIKESFAMSSSYLNRRGSNSS